MVACGAGAGEYACGELRVNDACACNGREARGCGIHGWTNVLRIAGRAWDHIYADRAWLVVGTIRRGRSIDGGWEQLRVRRRLLNRYGCLTLPILPARRMSELNFATSRRTAYHARLFRGSGSDASVARLHALHERRSRLALRGHGSGGIAVYVRCINGVVPLAFDTAWRNLGRRRL